ncbi:hypothetical protein GCM10022384_37160 [Streptomyces marokkonensis]|uniref:Fluoride-specific ion channel FluC n=1 Tax=Streptomyces marokkonensis TaxID=324855 RepID=A0ABP7QP42_9ACTN
MPAPNTESVTVRPALRFQAPVVVAVSLGGGAGAAARYAATLWWPTRTGGFPWTTFWVNVAGCAVIGVLMVVVTEVWAGHRLARPFLGTGVLGGFTTFSTYAVDIHDLLAADQVRTGLACLVATPLAALTAVWLATRTARRVLAPRTGGGPTDARGEGPS